MGSSQCQGDTVLIDDGRPDFGLVSDPEQLIGGELGAVAGVGQPSFGEQILEADGVTITDAGTPPTEG